MYKIVSIGQSLRLSPKVLGSPVLDKLGNPHRAELVIGKNNNRTTNNKEASSPGKILKLDNRAYYLTETPLRKNTRYVEYWAVSGEPSARSTALATQDEFRIRVYSSSEQSHVLKYLTSALFQVSHDQSFMPFISKIGQLDDGRLVVVSKFEDVKTLTRYIYDLKNMVNDSDPQSKQDADIKKQNSAIWQIIIQLFNAAGFMRSHGKIFGNFNLDNVFVTKSGRVRLLDFDFMVDQSQLKQAFKPAKADYFPPDVKHVHAQPEIIDSYAIGVIALHLFSLRSVLLILPPSNSNKQNIEQSNRKYLNLLSEGFDMDSRLPEKLVTLLLQALKAIPKNGDFHHYVFPYKRLAQQAGVLDKNGKPYQARKMEYRGECKQGQLTRKQSGLFEDKDIFFIEGSAYTVQKRLGKGTQGRVFLVTDANNGTFALKTCDVSRGQSPQEALEEAILTAGMGLKAPGVVVKIHKIGLIEGERRQGSVLCILMEYSAEGDLFDWVFDDDNSMGYDDCYDVAENVYKFVQVCRQEGVVHADLKLENVLVAKKRNQHTKGTYKVCDFGLSKPVHYFKTASHFGQFGKVPVDILTFRNKPWHIDSLSLGVMIVRMITKTDGYSRVERILGDNCVDLYMASESKDFSHFYNINSVSINFCRDLLQTLRQQVEREADLRGNFKLNQLIKLAQNLLNGVAVPEDLSFDEFLETCDPNKQPPKVRFAEI